MSPRNDSFYPDLIQVRYPIVLVPELSRKPAVAEVVQVALAQSVYRYMDNAPAVALDEDPEAVHQARVATRRLRSDLRTFRRFLDREWADHIRADLRTVTDVLGGVRDRDVMAMRFTTAIRQIPAQHRAAASPIMGVLEAERQRALAEVVEAFRKPSYVALVERLAEAATAPRTRRSADHRARPAMTKLARKPWRSLRKAIDELPNSPGSADLHRIRICAKRARYAAEAVAPVCDPVAALFAFRVSELQDILGEHQDATVAQAWLLSLDPSRATAAPALIDLEKVRAAQTAAGWRLVWDSIDCSGLTDWLEPVARD